MVKETKGISSSVHFDMVCRPACPRGRALPLLAMALSVLFALVSPGLSATVEAGPDVQAALDLAEPGDVVVVGPGPYDPITVDKPLTIQGWGSPTITAELQIPAVTVRADNVTISGLHIIGVHQDSKAKFDRYMESVSDSRGRALPMRLNLPEVALLVEGGGFLLENASLEGSEVGLQAEGETGISILNSSFDSCEIGVYLINCSGGLLEGCAFSSCTEEAGLMAFGSEMVMVKNSTATNNTHAGILFKESGTCLAKGNVLSRNAYGISLWNTSRSDVEDNEITRNYYGVLVAGSDNNTVLRNRLKDNARDEIIAGFGVGISLEDNSSYNVVAGNRIENSYNGLEITEGCVKNALLYNEVRDNKHGIRVDKNHNNLIYRNGFVDNLISAYDNQTHNSWNTTVGNYYDDYRGEDGNGDGIGDVPYVIPMGSSEAADYRPLMYPPGVWPAAGELDLAAVMRDLQEYASYEGAEDLPVMYSDGSAVIEYKRPSSRPKFKETKPLMDTMQETWQPMGF